MRPRDARRHGQAGDQGCENSLTDNQSDDVFPPDLVATFENLLSVERQKLEAQVRSGINQRVAELAKAGMLGSGRAWLTVVGEAKNSVPIFAQTAFVLLMRCMSAYGIPMNDTAAKAADGLLSGSIIQWHLRMRAVASEAPPFKGILPNQHAETVLSGISKTGHLEMDRLKGEISLLAAATVRVKEVQPFASRTERTTLASGY